MIEKYFKGTITAKNAQEHSGAVFEIIIPKNKMEISSSKFKFGRKFYLSTVIFTGIVVSGIMYYPQGFVGKAEDQQNQQVNLRQKNPRVVLKQTIENLLKPAVNINTHNLIEQSI